MQITNNKFLINSDEIDFNYREDSIGDVGVIKQIFANKDYDIAMYGWHQSRIFFDYYNKLDKTGLIIDAGANIGASAVFFNKIYPNSFIFTIEPDEANWHLLSINTSNLNIYNFNGAVSNVDGEVLLVDPGRSDWGFMTSSIGIESSNNSIPVKSISISSILNNALCSDKVPLILKIDIEGGEEALFTGDTEWMDKFPLIIMELHDHMLPFAGSSRGFFQSLAKYEFDFLFRGENVFLFNKRLLCP